MNTTLLTSLVGLGGVALGVVLTQVFELIKFKAKAVRDREDYIFRFFFEKRAEFYIRLFELYAEAHSKSVQHLFGEGDPVKLIEFFEPVNDFVKRGLIFPSSDVAKIATRFPGKQPQPGQTSLDVIDIAYSSYYELKDAIASELGKKYLPKEPSGKDSPKPK